MPINQQKSVAIVIIALVVTVPLGSYLYIQSAVMVNPLPVNSKVPSVVITSIDGVLLTTDSLFVRKTVAIFFTTSCEHCKIEMMDMNLLYPQFKDAINIIGISLNSQNETKEFVKKHSIAFPIFFDTTGIAKKQFRLLPMPALLYISSKKKLLKYQAGEQHKDSLCKTLDKFAAMSNDSLLVLW